MRLPAFSFDAEPYICPIPLPSVTPEWAWGNGTGKGVKVAVIDSGVDGSHPAVGPIQGYVSFTDGPDGLEVSLEKHEDSFGHGTACAGIIRSHAPECEIYSVKVLGESLSGRGNVFIEGLKWVVENGMQVCNMSLGTTKKDYWVSLHELADRGYFRNTVLVTAANNMPVPSFPSMYADVISVSSHAVDDPSIFYCNPRPPVWYSAMGLNVPVAWLDGHSKTGTGNSYAAPQISGLVTRIIGKHPKLTVFQVKVILHALATNADRH